jgi:hypothetical protein
MVDIAAIAGLTQSINAIRELAKAMVGLRDAEKQRYELTELATGSLAYVVKEAMRGPEPSHWLCAACCQQRKKSILQITGSRGPMGDVQIWGCHACNAAIWIRPK